MAWNRSSAAVRLLAVLSLTASCAAASQQPSDDTLLRSLQPLIETFRRLERSVYTLGTNLESQASQLAALVGSVQFQMNETTIKFASQQEQIDKLAVRLDNLEQGRKPHDCSDLQADVHSGVFLLWPGPDHAQPPVRAFCDMDSDGGNWTVFQRRGDFQPRQDFFQDWDAYRDGFGDLARDFWWGLDYMWRLTSVPDRQYELRINLEDFDGSQAYATYQGFQISTEEDGYKLKASDYHGNATDNLSVSYDRKFSTRDRDQDGDSETNCAVYHEAAWWFNDYDCSDSSLNGRYLGDVRNKTGIWWYKWTWWQSLKKTEMKIRPI